MMKDPSAHKLKSPYPIMGNPPSHLENSPPPLKKGQLESEKNS